jgi:DNA-binding CsgD family transcriptional regulator
MRRKAKKMTVRQKTAEQEEERSNLAAINDYIGFSCALSFIALFLTKGIGMTVFRLPVSLYTLALVMILLLVASQLNDFLRTERGLLCIRVCAACGGLGPVLLLISGFNLTFMFLVALGVASLTLLWGRFLSFQDHQILLLVTAVAFIVCGLFLMFVLDLSLTLTMVVMTVSALLSSLCDFLADRKALSAEHETNIALSRMRCTPGKGNRFTLITLGLALGVVMVMAAAVDYERRTADFLFGGAIVFASLVTMLFRARFRTLYEDVARRSLAVFTTATILPYPFLTSGGKVVCTCVLLFALTVNTLILIDAIAETSRLRKASPYWIVGKEGALFLSGMLIGQSIFWFLLIGKASASFAAQACMATVTVFVLMQIFIENQTYPYFDENLPEKSKTVDPALARAESFSTKGGSVWKKKIEMVACEKKLSPRQKEVMKLLAKGRDVKYIMNHFVISRATAKTHMYNLYRKLDVHSRQELLNLIEETSPKED